MTQMNLSMKQKQNHRHREQTDGCQGQGAGLGEGWSGRLGIADVNYYIQTGRTTRSSCTTQGTILGIL